jgi:hypothetical protein
MLSQRRTRDLIIVAVFLLIIVLLFWPSRDDEQETDAALNNDFSETTPSPESTPTVEEDSDSSTDIGEQCVPGDSERLLYRWVGAVNAGDHDTLAEMLPASGSSTPSSNSYPGMDQRILHSFLVHESGTMSDPDSVLGYLTSRVSEANERWRIDEVDVHRLERGQSADGDELDRANVRFLRSADDLPDHEIHGTVVLNCMTGQVLLVDLITEHAELALPIDVEDFLAAVGPYGTGEMRDLRMIVSTDIREDTGSLRQWDIRRIEANSMSGSYVERVNVQTLNGNEILEYVYDGSRWYLQHRGWREVGDLTGWGVLPLEIMLTRREPSVTADLIRDHLEEIPAEGPHTLAGTFEVRDDLNRALATIPLSEPVEGILEVDLEDGNLVRTRYRIVDRQLGVNLDVPEIQWVHIHRRDRYEPPQFTRPQGFTLDEPQYAPPATFQDQFQLIERLDHLDGIGERYEVELNGSTYTLLISPSRGSSHEETRGDDWPLTWERELHEIGGQIVVLGGPPDEALPVAAIWDTRRYRYELTIDPEQLADPDSWQFTDMQDEILELLQAEASDSALRWIGPGS